MVQHYYGIVGHPCIQAVLSMVREKFGIIKARSAVRHCLRECRNCRFWKSKACKQLTAPLPKCRVSTNNNPLTCTGVDYFEPLLVKVGRSRVE